MTNEKLRELFWQERARLLALIEACESGDRFMELATPYRRQSDAASALVAAPPGAEQCRNYMHRGEKLASITKAIEIAYVEGSDDAPLLNKIRAIASEHEHA